VKKNRGIIVFLIVVFAFGAIFDYYSDKTGERLTQDLIKAEKRLAKAKDTIPLIPLVPVKKIDSL
tara:strand:+ start:142 stop:336 length:195 start_codon:yes stop_codon:yes gene_type:complete